jgi:hypothetical protein
LLPEPTTSSSGTHLDLRSSASTRRSSWPLRRRWGPTRRRSSRPSEHEGDRPPRSDRGSAKHRR